MDEFYHNVTSPVWLLSVVVVGLVISMVSVYMARALDNSTGHPVTPTMQMTDADDRYVSEIAVASIDLLGVKNLIERTDQNLSAMDIVSRFVRNATSSGTYREPDFNSKIGDSFNIDLYFGDSVYLFADAALPLQKQVEGLVMKVASLIAIGLQGERNFLVRAGIAIGDLRTRVAWNERSAREIRLGTAMLRAHLLENSQKWIGGAIAEGTPIKQGLGAWTMRYPVPVKGAGGDVSNVLALNWISKDWPAGRIEAKLRATVEAIGGGEDEIKKMDNTLAFVRHVFETGAFAPMQQFEE